MTKSFDKEFLGEIRGAYENVRDHRVVTLLEVATVLDGSEANDGRLQQNYIDDALKLGRNEFETVLREKLSQSDAPLADRARAAFLFIRGHELKLWRMSPRTGRLARRLAQNFEEENGLEETFSGPLHLAIMDGGHEVARMRVDQSVILGYFRLALANKNASHHDRLAISVEILKGAVADLWPVPGELKQELDARK
jgi:hypothetical protein